MKEKIGSDSYSKKSYKGRRSNDPATNLFCLYFNASVLLFLTEPLVLSRDLLYGGLPGVKGRQHLSCLFCTR